jgi:hypothetical protein
MSFSFLCIGIQLQFSVDSSDEAIESLLSYHCCYPEFSQERWLVLDAELLE